MKRRLPAVTSLRSGLTGSTLSVSIRPVQVGRKIHGYFWTRRGRLLEVGLAGLVMLVLAGCSRPWQEREPETGEDTPAVSAVTVRELASPSPRPVTTATPALAARVNGQPISLEEYELRLAEAEAELLPHGVTTPTAGDEDRPIGFDQQVLDEMIDSVLVQQAASELGVVPSDAEIAAQVQADILEGGGSLAFSEWLAATGQTVAEYSAEVRASLILQRVVLAVTAEVALGLEGAPELRTLAFQEWLAARRAGATIERFIGN